MKPILLLFCAAVSFAQVAPDCTNGCGLVTYDGQHFTLHPLSVPVTPPPPSSACLPADTGLPPLPASTVLPALPQGCTVPDYPKPIGPPVVVATSAALQSALNSVKCGGWVQVAAGAFAGSSAVPGTACPASNPILVENIHMRDVCAAGSPAPCGAPGFAVGAALFPASTYPSRSLAGSAWVPTLQGTSISAVLTIADNAAGWFIAGLEVTLDITSPTNKTRPIVGMGETTTSITALPHNIWLWQMLIHPAPCQADSMNAPCSYSGRGVDLNLVGGGVYYSSIWGIVAPGQDTQAINVNNTTGPVTAIGNDLEASGENLMLNTECSNISGTVSNPAPGTTQGSTGWLPNDIGIHTCPVPSNVTVRLNHFQKDPAWQSLPAGCNASAAQCYDVKNHFECKYCSAVLVDGNFFDTTFPNGQSSFLSVNCWATGIYVCSDITFSNLVVAHGAPNGSTLTSVGYVAGNGMPVLCLTCGNTGTPQVQSAVRILYRNILATDIAGAFFQVQNSSWITFDHITAINGSKMTTITNALNFSDGPPSSNQHFQATNLLLFGSPFNNGGNPGSAIAGLPSPVLGGDYFVGDWWTAPSIFNVPNTPAYPAGVQSLSSNVISIPGTPPVLCLNHNSNTQQCWPIDWALAGMVDFAGASTGANLAGAALGSNSPLKGKGTDGRDVGANVPAILAAIAGVK